MNDFDMCIHFYTTIEGNNSINIRENNYCIISPHKNKFSCTNSFNNFNTDRNFLILTKFRSVFKTKIVLIFYLI